MLFTLLYHKHIQTTIFITKLFKSRLNCSVQYILWIDNIQLFLVISCLFSDFRIKTSCLAVTTQLGIRYIDTIFIYFNYLKIERIDHTTYL